MIVKQIPKESAINYFAKNQFYNINPHSNFNLTDNPNRRLENTSNFFNKHNALLDDGYLLRGNEKDVKGTIYKRFSKEKIWMGIFDNDILKGINYYVTSRVGNIPLPNEVFSAFVKPSTEYTIEMFDSLLFADSEDIAAELNKKLFIWTTRNKWNVNYSYRLDCYNMFDMKFYESLGYRGWANLEMGDDLNEKNRLTMNFLKRLPEAFDD